MFEDVYPDPRQPRAVVVLPGLSLDRETLTSGHSIGLAGRPSSPHAVHVRPEQRPHEGAASLLASSIVASIVASARALSPTLILGPEHAASESSAPATSHRRS